jgi:hypothetical protein
MQRAALELRIARLGRAIERAASDAPSEARQTALETLAHFAADLAAHFEEREQALAPASPRRAQHARLRGDLRALEERARSAGDWPESWRSVQREFERFVAALAEYENTEARPHREP